MSWTSDKTGRPKEEGGHLRINFSAEKFVAEALKKVDNKSKFLESVARPVLKKMDPGEASVFLWQVDALIIRGISKATREGDFEQIQSLGWLASQLDDARNLCGIPPENLTSEGSSGALNFEDRFKYHCFVNLEQISNEPLGNSFSALHQIRHLILTLPQPMKEQLIPSLNETFKKVKESTRNDTHLTQMRLAKFEVEKLIDKVSSLLHKG